MKFKVYKDRRGEWRWRLLAANNRKIADSGEGYLNQSDALDAIKLVCAADENTKIEIQEK